MPVVVEIKGVKETVAAMKQAANGQGIDDRLRVTANAVAANTAAAAPKKSGDLAKSIKAVRAGHYTYHVREGVSYGKYIRSGTRPRSIFPNGKGALYWDTIGHPIDFVGPPLTKRYPGIRGNKVVKYDIEGINRSQGDFVQLASFLTKKFTLRVSTP